MRLMVLGAFWHPTWIVCVFSSPSLNAPFGARCFLTFNSRFRLLRRPLCLNAPFGAHLAGWPENVACNSTDSPSSFEVRTLNFCCFLVLVDTCSRKLHARFRVLGALWNAKGRGASSVTRFNAPFGARCFLTKGTHSVFAVIGVLMHRLALGAF